MKKDSYILFSEFYNQSKHDESKISFSEFFIQNQLNLELILKSAFRAKNYLHIEFIFEAIRSEYLLVDAPSSQLNTLFEVAIDFVKIQTTEINSQLMWLVKQVFDIELHQSHLMRTESNHQPLFFELCYEILAPRFHLLIESDEEESYLDCVHWVIYSIGHFRNHPSELRRLQPRIEPILIENYGTNHHLKVKWFQLFNELKPE